jgi:hypothetical protein
MNRTSKNLKGEIDKMAKLKEIVSEYKTPETRNVSDLPYISLGEEIYERTYTKDDGTQFSIQVLIRLEDGEEVEYRVPKSVIAQAKTLLDTDDTLDTIRVVRTGSGMNTRYQVMPYKA